MLFLDGVYVERPNGTARFRWVKAPTSADERKKLERLCRYISRPAVSEKRLSLTPNGNVRYQLKTPYRDGTKHVIFDLLDFIARLAALVPKPRVNLTRFHASFKNMGTHADSTDSKILRRIQGRKRRWVFTPDSFTDLGTRGLSIWH
jgi:hypothetical protein